MSQLYIIVTIAISITATLIARFIWDRYMKEEITIKGINYAKH